MKKLACLLLAALLLAASLPVAALETASGLDIAAPSGILVHASGKILFEKNAHEPLIPASVTKVMTLLLAIEALDSGTLSLEEMVTASAHASSMGGTQIWLEEGEQLSVDDMLKCIAVVSANDCSVALAEHMAGSEEAFVARMNERAAQLGMLDTNFVNCSGLPAQGHLTSAYDIALMSLELMRHERITAYTTIWQDTIRNGAFGLDNTNKLLKSYDGLTGLKTGYTGADSGYCISATATRGDMALIAVIMKGATRDSRNADVTRLLNYGFANYVSVALTPDTPIMPVEVLLGESSQVACDLSDNTPQVYEKAKLAQVEKEIVMNGPLAAPVDAGTPVGELVVRAGGEVIARVPIVTLTAVERQGLWDIFCSLVRAMTMRK